MVKRLLITFFMLTVMLPVHAGKGACCSGMGGIHWCDSSAGRYVCQNGEFSACYCSRHAVMELQLLEGCCLWNGGVLKKDGLGLVICNNGSVSEICSTQDPKEKYSTW